MAYLMTRKEVDEAVIAWEKLHGKDEQTESMAMYLVKQQFLHMADELFKDGLCFNKLESAKEKLEGKC